jgi:prevent-host-death family protein
MVTESRMESSMPAGKFKASCLKVMDEVAATGRSVVITKRGKAVARLVPAAGRPAPIAGALAGSVEISGDILSPVDVQWNAAA